MRPFIVVVIVLVVAVVLIIVMNVTMRRQGYAIPGRAAVRCKDGHLFRVMWIEGGSFRAVRMGPRTRYLYCPVGQHRSVVHAIKEADLTEAERAELGAP